MVCGEDPGPAKVEKAEKMNVPILYEDAFYELVNSFKPKEVAVAVPDGSMLSKLTSGVN